MITEKDSTMELRHQCGGNGMAVVQWLGNEYCRVVRITRDGIGDQAFLAWTKLMSVETKDKRPVRLNDEVLECVQKLTKDLKNGRRRIVQTRIV